MLVYLSSIDSSTRTLRSLASATQRSIPGTDPATPGRRTGRAGHHHPAPDSYRRLHASRVMTFRRATSIAGGPSAVHTVIFLLAERVADVRPPSSRLWCGQESETSPVWGVRSSRVMVTSGPSSGERAARLLPMRW